MEKANKITGFGFANPNILLAVIKYSKYIPIPIFDATQKSYDSIKTMWKRHKADPRRKVVLVKGLDVLERLKADAPVDLSQSIVTVFDALNKLAVRQEVAMVDATPGTAKDASLPTFTPLRFDLDTVLEGSAIGLPELTMSTVEAFAEAVVEDAVEAPPPKVKTPKKTAKERAPAPEVVEEAVAEQVPAPAPVVSDSLAALFDVFLASIADEKLRNKASQWVAARIEGLLDKDTWQKALTKMQAGGAEPELVRASMRVLKETGRLQSLRNAYRDTVDNGARPTTAALRAGVSVDDLKWLLARWTE